MLIKVCEILSLLPIIVGVSKGPLLPSSAPTPVAMGLPKRQRQSEMQRTENLTLTTQLVLILHQLPNWDKLCISVLKLPAPESMVNYTVILQDPTGSKLSLPQWLQIPRLLVNAETVRCLLYFPLPPTSYFPFYFFFPPYLVPFVYSVSYLRQELSLPMCLCSALHEG